MWMNGQTLRHKKTNKLVRLLPETGSFAWNIGPETKFINEQGNVFLDDSNNYTHIEDELGDVVDNDPDKGEFVDMSAKKYLVPAIELKQMRNKTLGIFELKILTEMETANKIICPFSNEGHNSPLIEKSFLANRNALPLTTYEKVGGELAGTQYCFMHKGQLWMYDENELKPIDEKLIKAIALLAELS